MTGIKSNGLSDREEGRVDSVAHRGDVDTELLTAFSTSCGGRMLIGFDVAAWRKEQTRVHVVNQQDIEAVVIEKDDIDTRCRAGVAGFDRRKTSSVSSSHLSVSAMCSASNGSSGAMLATRS